MPRARSGELRRGSELDAPGTFRLMSLSVRQAPSISEPEARSTDTNPREDYALEVTAREVSAMSRYYDRLIQYAPTPDDDGSLLRAIESPSKLTVEEGAPLPDLKGHADTRAIILLNGVLNQNYDIEKMLTTVRASLSRSSRVVIVAYNPYQRLLRGLSFGSRPSHASTFFTLTQLRTVARLAGLQIVRVRPTAFINHKLLGAGKVLNHALGAVPGMQNFSTAWVVVMRASWSEPVRPSLSVVIPARNERGNISSAVERLRGLNEQLDLEVIFVEGHSSDGTWEEILRVKQEFSSEFRIVALRQTGQGKNDAVRLGFANATKELLTILDADLTMPPELLHRFYDAYCAGLGDFINGDRLLYPMEGNAMRPLNLLGNIFFAKALSNILDTPLGDTLCGTKLLSAADYKRILAWRADFGDFDPFGDFELLFPAAVLGLGIVDVPIRYRDRTYGATQISRFRHGAMLLKMSAIGLRKIKTGSM